MLLEHERNFGLGMDALVNVFIQAAPHAVEHVSACKDPAPL